jgi:hypothetical protein
MTPQECNILIAEWLGWEFPYPDAPEYMYHPEKDMHSMIDYHNYHGGRKAFDLLDVLVDKNLYPSLNYVEQLQCWHLRVWCPKRGDIVRLPNPKHKTKSQAICEAICELIRKEKGDE